MRKTFVRCMGMWTQLLTHLLPILVIQCTFTHYICSWNRHTWTASMHLAYLPRRELISCRVCHHSHPFPVPLHSVRFVDNSSLRHGVVRLRPVCFRSMLEQNNFAAVPAASLQRQKLSSRKKQNVTATSTAPPVFSPTVRATCADAGDGDSAREVHTECAHETSLLP